ncbi:ATP-dependent sacrificial sulfur transferase LarE [Sphaerisporangium sp. TRM90804]|uniref:ATP-dependent sacrificial sulfur transferase LarE n=1 Tax=Sphaerisporangium sp. TRM90804 TaxID=3031113 RepID=UPI00244D3F17|nr:ATP-dependent sacrificial sulfur transferase LarE [Sphaerisporangium sp. TRM90804]MDH2430773.1 ATP-dependent sacrificial sulfur transferase LarE [Sphaerisporangium sp. TRM90804]
MTDHPVPANPAGAGQGDGMERLTARLRLEKAVVVAYSGGADSALLAFAAARVLGTRALAVTAVSPSLAASERAAARAFARRHGLAHVEVCTDEAERPEYAANGADRCYHCKSALFDALAPLAAAMDARVALGTNLDDLGDHRPGQRAAAERGAVAPLVDAGLTKAGVRAVSRELGLATADKPAAPCLASRVSYGDPVTPEVLRRVEAAEAALRELGFPVCRVRAHAGGTLARVEVPRAEIPRVGELRERVDAAVRGAGFTFCSLDLSGFASGRLNALLPLLPS